MSNTNTNDKYLSGFKPYQMPICKCEHEYGDHDGKTLECPECNDGHKFDFSGWVREGQIRHHDIL